MSKIFKSHRLAGYYCRGNPRLDYDLFLVNEKTGEKTLLNEIRQQMCFGSLPGAIKIEEGHRTILEYILKKHDFKVRDTTLTKRDIVVWLRVAKGAKFLPKSVGPHDLTSKEGMANRTPIDITGLPPSLLYIYLTVIRMIQETPAMVRMIPSLVKGYKLDFPSAWVFASKCTMNVQLHNFVPCSSSGYPGTYPDINETKDISLAQILALKAYIKNPKKYDNDVVAPGMRRGAEKVLGEIVRSFSTDIFLKAEDFLDPVKREAIKTATNPQEYLNIINSQTKAPQLLAQFP